MWQVAFSSNSVSKNVMPVCPTRDSPSTSATSPSRFAELVDAHLRAHSVGAGRRADLDGVAALEAHLEIAHDRPAERQRPRRADGALRAPPIGAVEDLFGRQVRHMSMPPRGRDRRRLSSASRQEADRQVGARAAEANRVECLLVELRAARAEACGVLAPRGDRIVLVSRTACATASHSRSTSGSPKTCIACPSVGYAAIVQLTAFSFCAFSWRFMRVDRTRLADAFLVEVGEELGLRVAGDHDDRPAVRERLGARQLPRRRRGQILVGGMLDERRAGGGCRRSAASTSRAPAA